MKRFFIIILLFFTVMLFAEKITLTNGVLLESDPVYMKYAAVLKEIYRRAGIELEIVALPGIRSLVMADSGKFDGEFLRVKETLVNYSNLIVIDEPVLFTYIYAFGRKGAPITIDGWDSLKDKRVLYKRGAGHFVEKLIGNMKTGTIEILDNFEQGIKMILSNRADVLVAPPEQISTLMKNPEYSDFIRLDPPLNEIPVYTCLHARHKKLVPKLLTILQGMKKDGSFEKILINN